LTARRLAATLKRMGEDAGWVFEAWRVCSHCKGSGIETAAPAVPGVPSIACSQCAGGTRPGYASDSKTLLTLVELAEALRPLLKAT
jgi:DnaJ-class molecular chaperone